MKENQFTRYGAIARAVQHLGPQGKFFFVGPSAAAWYGDFLYNFGNDQDGAPRVYSTITAAISACTASRGDVIIVLPGYTQTVTSAIDVSKAGVSIIGVGQGALKPTITVGGAIDGITCSAASTRVENIHFAAPSVDEATAMINVAAAGVTLRNISGIGSTTSINFVDCITIASGADDLTIEGLEIYNTTVAVNSFISIEAAVARLKLVDIFCFGDVATAGIIDAATATQMNWLRVNIGVVGTSKPAATLDSNPTGLIRNCNFSGTSTTLATNAALGTGVRLFDVKVLEETGGAAQGALIPAVDAD